MKEVHPQISQISQIGKICAHLRHLRIPPKTAALAIIALLYLGTGGLCLSQPVQRPWGQPTPEAKWADPVPRDDPRPFWLRLLLSLRYDLLHRDIRGGADF